MDGSPPGSPVPGILQARTLEWVAMSFSNAWKWKVKVKSLSRVWLLATPWTAANQAPWSMGFSRQECWNGLPLLGRVKNIWEKKSSWSSKTRNLNFSVAGNYLYSICIVLNIVPGFNPWVRKILWRRKWQPTPVLLPGKFHGQRSLVGYSPWGCKELDKTFTFKDDLRYISKYV